jgi:putative endopeptidase
MSRLPPIRALLAACLCVALSAAAQTDAVDQPLQALPYSPSLDLGSLEPGADPCVDFYRYACGGWQRKNPIPPDQAGWDVYGKLQEENLRYLWGLLLDAAEPRAERSPAQRKAGDYFAACMDEAGVDAAGLAPLQPSLQRIAALGSKRELAGLLASLHLSGTDDAMFSFGAEQDFRDATRVIATVDAGGLGLADRDQYLLGDARSKALRAAYQQYVMRMFELLGDSGAQARAAARTVLAIETELAKASLTREARRDPRRIYHRMSLAQLRRMAPGFDWHAYLQASAVPAGTPINLTEPRFLLRLGSLIAQRPLADWQQYLRWQLANARAPYLSQPVAGAWFDFHLKTLRGVERTPPRWKQCVRWVDRDLGEALGQLFVQRTFSPPTRERATRMVQAVEQAMDTRIRQLDWMSATTKKAALAKLHALVNKIGYPPAWRDYAALEIRRDDFFGNVARGQGFEARRQRAKIGRPVDRDEWVMTPPTVNAYYDAQLNAMNFPAGILQPPLFDPSLDDAPNYGNTGSTIGHELTHGFDDEGRQFDAKGNLRDWWGPRDTARFNERAACVARQYSGYTIVDDVKINGRLTLGEDVADLGGTVLAYIAWKTVTAGQPVLPRDGFTPDQRFFIGMAQWACSNDRPQALRLRALTGLHSPNRHRVNGVLSNLPEFAKAFSCKPGQPMVRDKPCKVW